MPECSLSSYVTSILQLPDKKRYEQKDLLTDEFLIKRKEHIEIYYAAHNEYINKDAAIFIVGITPGWTQMERSIFTARECLLQGLSIEKTKKIAKRKSRFAGVMRQNLIEMLNQLNIPQYLNINDSKELFEQKDHLLHTTSLIKFPVFIRGKNYNGHSPDFLKEPFLKSYLDQYFYDELVKLQHALIIPLGRTVDKVMRLLTKEHQVTDDQCLFGFPHPSGANGHRIRQLRLRQEELKEKIKLFF